MGAMIGTIHSLTTKLRYMDFAMILGMAASTLTMTPSTVGMIQITISQIQIQIVIMRRSLIM